MDPIKALYWSAVANGVLGPPVMALMLLLVRKKMVMGDLQVEGRLYWLGWIATIAMALRLSAWCSTHSVKDDLKMRCGEKSRVHVI